LWLEEAASPLARACPREAARRPSRPPWPARSPSCACWCRRPPRRRSAWRAASVGRSARPAAEPPPLPARNRARPPRGPPAPAGPPPRRSRRARWPARPPRRRGALRRPRRRGPGVCPTRDGGRRLLHAERHRHESQGGRDQGVSRRRALCCSPSTCSRGADMRRQDVSVCGLRGPSQGPRAVARDDGGRCESRSRGWGPAYWASTARASTTSGRPWGTLRPSPALCRWRPAGAALSPPSPYIGRASVRPHHPRGCAPRKPGREGSLIRACPPLAKVWGWHGLFRTEGFFVPPRRESRGAWAAHAFFRAEPAGRHLRRCRCHRRKRACSQS
ncbi:unnamed protein product, partial [Prorocentrum cordatum]